MENLFFWKLKFFYLSLAGVGRFLQPSCHLLGYDLVHSTFANPWQLCRISALFSISFSVFLFLSHQLLIVVPLLNPFLHPSSILSICPNHRNLCSLRNCSNLSTHIISRIFSLFILSFKIFKAFLLDFQHYNGHCERVKRSPCVADR